METMTLNPGFGAAKDVDRLGRFRRGEPRQVELTEAEREQFNRGRMWTIETPKPKKPAPKPKE